MTGDLGPEQIKDRLRKLVNDLGMATIALARARDAEVELKHEYLAAKRAARFSPDRPIPNRTTILADDVEAWIGQRTKELHKAYDVAVANREAASDHLWTLKDQAGIVMSLNATERALYQMAGTQ